MKKALLFFLFAAFCCIAATAQIIAVRAGKLVDTDSGTVKSNVVLLINAENGRIKAVGSEIAIPPGAKVIDLSNKTVLPGLIDCHTHLVGNANDLDPLSELHKTSAQRAFESALPVILSSAPAASRRMVAAPACQSRNSAS